MKHLYYVNIILFLTGLTAYAQLPASHEGYVEVGGMAASSARTPFWLRANQFGTVPLSAPAGTGRAGIRGRMLLTDTTKQTARKPWTVSYGAELVGNAGRDNQLLAPEYFVSLTHRQIQLTAGRRREVIGLVDTTLSSGSYAWSGNALPLPKIQFGTRGFAPLGRRQWLAINAFIAHGLFANTDYMQHSFLHQKSIILRVGKPTSAIRVYGGINHSVQWGGHSNFLDHHYAVNGQLPGQSRDFPNVLFAIRMGGLDNPRVTSFDYVNLYGNHVGSIDLGMELRLASVQLMLYHQHSFDDASGMLLQNVPDGLSGLRIRPLKRGSAGFHIDAVLVEFLSTLHQSGPSFYQANTHTKGADNYFNNMQYAEGWTYNDRVIGTPFITRKQDLSPDLQNNTQWTINNNRVQMAHLGLSATLAQRVSCLAKVSYSQNYGVPGEPLPGTPSQWSSLLQLQTPVSWMGGMTLTAAVAADIGELYTNSIGGSVGLRKTVWQK